MRILVITPFYAPDLGASASLYEMLCEGLVQLGHQVSVVCAVPHYPTGRVASDFRGRLVQAENRQGVEVHRVWVPSIDRSKLARRLLSFLCYQFLALFVGVRLEYDAVIASNPSFEVALPLLLLGFMRKKRVIYSVHEIYPEVGIKLGVFRHRTVTRVLEWMERFCCRRAAHVRVISDGYKSKLVGKGVPQSKLAVIWDWIDTDFVRPLPRHNAFSARWDLDDCFVVLYAGNIGPTQGLEIVIDAAELTKDPDICFVIVGDGASKFSLERLVHLRNLGNVTFVPFQPRDMLPQVLATADVSLVTLKKHLGADSVPSKLYSILASGRPVIAAVDEGSDICALVRQARCGVVTEPEDPSALAEAIRNMAGDGELRTCLGENGRAFVSKSHSKTQAALRFQELLLDDWNGEEGSVEEEPVSEFQASSHG